MASKIDKKVYAVRDSGNGKSFWTEIGVGFFNKDGSLNLKLNLIATDPNTTIQVRDPRETTDSAAE